MILQTAATIPSDGGVYGSDDQDSDSSEDTVSSSDATTVPAENKGFSNDSKRGKSRKWSPLDEKRLEAYKKRGQIRAMDRQKVGPNRVCCLLALENNVWEERLRRCKRVRVRSRLAPDRLLKQLQADRLRR